MTPKDSLDMTKAKSPQATNGSLRASELLRQYGCGPDTLRRNRERII